MDMDRAVGSGRGVGVRRRRLRRRRRGGGGGGGGGVEQSRSHVSLASKVFFFFFHCVRACVRARVRVFVSFVCLFVRSFLFYFISLTGRGRSNNEERPEPVYIERRRTPFREMTLTHIYYLFHRNGIYHFYLFHLIHKSLSALNINKK
jgi:hypothetical protein